MVVPSTWWVWQPRYRKEWLPSQSGRGQVGRYDAQTSRGCGQGCDRAHVYVILSQPKVESFDAMITGTILFCDHMDCILFNLESTFSYVSVKFALGRDLDCEQLNIPMHVSTLAEVFVCSNLVYQVCPKMFMGYKTLADQVIIDIEEFDIIFGMSWLYPYCTILDCYAKTVTIVMPGMGGLERDSTFKPTPMRIMIAIPAKKIAKWGVGHFLFIFGKKVQQFLLQLRF